MIRFGRSTATRLTTNLLGIRNDPYGAFNFLVEIEGLIAGGFTSVSGLQITIETEDVREGGENHFKHRLPGPASYGQNLVLSHGLTDIDTLWEWQEDVAQGRIVRRNGTIYLLNQHATPVMWWDFHKAYPVRWSGPEFRAESSTVAIESIELAHEGITSSGTGLAAGAARTLARSAGLIG